MPNHERTDMLTSYTLLFVGCIVPIVATTEEGLVGLICETVEKSQRKEDTKSMLFQKGPSLLFL